MLVDGENIGATLGVTILGHRPEPNERPRWERVIDFARPFMAVLQGIGFRPVPVVGGRDENVVDVDLDVDNQRTKAAITARSGCAAAQPRPRLRRPRDGHDGVTQHRQVTQEVVEVAAGLAMRFAGLDASRVTAIDREADAPRAMWRRQRA